MVDLLTLLSFLFFKKRTLKLFRKAAVIVKPFPQASFLIKTMPKLCLPPSWCKNLLTTKSNYVKLNSKLILALKIILSLALNKLAALHSCISVKSQNLGE